MTFILTSNIGWPNFMEVHNAVPTSSKITKGRCLCQNQIKEWGKICPCLFWVMPLCMAH